MCETECEAEDAIVEWNMFKDDVANHINITFILDNAVSDFMNNLGVAGQEHITSQMRVTEDRELEIEKVSLGIHDSTYTCKTYNSSTRLQCGVTFPITPVIITLCKI